MTDKQPEALAALVREAFDYADGHLLHRRKKHCSQRAGTIAGSQKRSGYRDVRFVGRVWKEHRLVFLWHFGWLPDVVDHVDGNKSNNRIENLRACSKSQNGMNRHSHSSATGRRNVYKKKSGFQVAVGVAGKRLYIGTYASIEAADAAAHEARRQHFGEFA